jgi:hypothetical protein
MANFDKYSNFDKNANFESVKFGGNTKILEVELNEMQNIQSEARADMIRESIPSGFTTLGDIDYTTMATSPNTIKTSADNIAWVNGYKITIPAGTVITLNAPPTTGTREDLVFLEVWKEEIDCTETVTTGGKDGGTALTNNIKDSRIGTETSRRIQLRYRLRVVDGVDFTRLSEGIGTTNDATYSPCLVQGANPAPIANNVDYSYWFRKSTGKAEGGFSITALNFNDNGMYVAGLGNTQYKTAFGTVDGFVYAIPMFKVHRRNSGGYSVSNGNGSSNSRKQNFTSPVAIFGQVVTITTTDTTGLSVGNKLAVYANNAIIWRIESIVNATTITATCLYGSGYPVVTDSYRVLWGRADKLESDVVVDRDIVDLRHQVSLTGFNYQALLEENFDKLLRGELQTSARTNMMKTYHGISKTPIDANHVFYASLDGTSVAEVGGALTLGAGNFKPSPIGLGYKFSNSTANPVSVSGLSADQGTVDCMVDFSNISPNNAIFSLLDSSGYYCIEALIGGSNAIQFYASKTHGKHADALSTQYTFGTLIGYHHLRFTWKLNGACCIYIDGKLVLSSNMYTTSALIPTQVMIGGIKSVDTSLIYASNTAISDISVSNVDRGAIFATLPQDVIDGYARVMPAFNEQRQILSDSLTSEYKLEIVRASGETRRQFTITQATTGVWASGDTLKVKGLAGEIISGVIDTDTALCKLSQSTTNGVIVYVDDVSKLAVNDTIQFIDPTSGSFVLDGAIRTITATDTTNKTITLSSSISVAITDLIFETTVSTSSPVLKSVLGSVVGTWSNLGTNQATFTFGTNAGLTNQSLQIEYSSSEIAGQGGIPEVLTATLAGEIGGKRLAINPSIHIRDDLAGKVVSSVIENPNIFRRTNTVSTLKAPSDVAWYEPSQADIDAVTTINGSTSLVSSNVNGSIAQQLLSFNIVEMVERKYGTIPALDLAGKVAWVRNNMKTITFNWYGYGTYPGGNKAYLSEWNNGGQNMFGSQINPTYAQSHVSGSVAKLVNVQGGAFDIYIDTNGYAHYVVYAGTSDGVTASVIYSDHCNIEILLKTPTGYDVLTSENPRRDDGKSNILLVRKEAREIQVMFSGVNNVSGIITYGDYIPVNALYPGALSGGKTLTAMKAFATSLTTRLSTNVYNLRTKFDLLDDFRILDNSVNSSLANGISLSKQVDTVMQNNIIPIDIIGHHKAYARSFIGKIKITDGKGLCLEDFIIIYFDTSKVTNADARFIPGIYQLAMTSNGNLYLLIAMSTGTLKTLQLDGQNYGRVIAYQIANRPLIK